MSEFYKRFLMNDGRKLNPDTGRFVALGAFGKHPGWDDHVEDLGLETDSLNLAKRVLYVQGVGGQIDTGAWEKLKEEQRLPAFNHSFVWQRGDQFLAGRLWSSSDGKGRTRYPMILCAHCLGVSLPWVLESVLPRLAEAENACQATKSAEEVRSILSRNRTALRNMIIGATSDPARDAVSASALRQFVSSAPLGPDREGLFRILYWLQSQAGGFAPGRFDLKEEISGLRAQQVRVPTSCASAVNQAIQLWSRFFSVQVDPAVPALVMWPFGGDWMDVTFGEPATHEFFCLRASRVAVPLATEIPYDLDPKFRDRAARQLDDFENGRPVRPATQIFEREQDDQKPSGFVSVTQRWFKSLGGKGGLFLIALLGIAAIAGYAFLHSKAGTTSIAEPPVQSVSRPQRGPPDQATPEPADSAQPAKAQTPLGSNQTPPTSGQVQSATPPKTPQTATEKSSNVAAPTQTQNLASQILNPSQSTSPPPAVPSSGVPPVQTPTSAAAAASAAVADAVPKSVPVSPGTTASPASSPSSSPVVAPHENITNGIGMVLLWVPGLPASGPGGWVGRYEVTQAEYEKVTGSNPSEFKDSAQPVEYLTYQNAIQFCQKLTVDERAAGRLPERFAYALPTETQWDYFLANASFDDAITSRGMVTPRSAPERVGTKLPNRFGLCDVLGNVWEWCTASGSADPQVLKGGGYDNGVSFQFKILEPTTTRHIAPGNKSKDAGFRCVVVPQP